MRRRLTADRGVGFHQGLAEPFGAGASLSTMLRMVPLSHKGEEDTKTPPPFPERAFLKSDA
jgi:hypothetical protein